MAYTWSAELKPAPWGPPSSPAHGKREWRWKGHTMAAELKGGEWLVPYSVTTSLTCTG